MSTNEFWFHQPEPPKLQNRRRKFAGIAFAVAAVAGALWGGAQLLDSYLNEENQQIGNIITRLKKQIVLQQKIIDDDYKQMAIYQKYTKNLGYQIDNLEKQNEELQSVQDRYDDLRNEITRYTLETRGAVKCKDAHDDVFTIAAEEVNKNDFLSDFVVDGIVSGRCDPMLLLPIYKVMEFYNLNFDPDLSDPSFPQIQISRQSLGD